MAAGLSVTASPAMDGGAVAAPMDGRGQAVTRRRGQALWGATSPWARQTRGGDSLAGAGCQCGAMLALGREPTIDRLGFHRMGNGTLLFAMHWLAHSVPGVTCQKKRGWRQGQAQKAWGWLSLSTETGLARCDNTKSACRQNLVAGATTPRRASRQLYTKSIAARRRCGLAWLITSRNFPWPRLS